MRLEHPPCNVIGDRTVHLAVHMVSWAGMRMAFTANMPLLVD